MNRDTYFDNLKFIAITLVIIGHSIEPLIDRMSLAKSLYVFIYSFHMPLFAFISGRFSITGMEKKHSIKLIKRVLFPYLILEIIYSTFHHFLFNTREFTIGFAVPYWLLWYLMSLFFWRIMVLFFNNLKAPIVIAFALGLLCGLSDQFGYTLSLSRTFVFFPFFLIGYKSHDFDLFFLKKKQFKVISVFLLATFLICIFNIKFIQNFKVQWLYGSYSYINFNDNLYFGILVRSIIYFIAVVIGISIMSLTPKRHLIFSNIGSNCMYAYVLHGFCVQSSARLGLFHSINSDSEIIALCFGAIILTVILTLKPFRIITDAIVSPKYLHFLLLRHSSKATN